MLTLAYDEIAVSDDEARARPNGAAVAGRFAAGWLLRLALLLPERIRLARTEDALGAGRPFAYPLELTAASLRGGPPDLAAGLPPAVIAQARRGSAVIVVWLGHAAVPLELDPAGTVWLFDVIERLIIEQGLPHDSVWLVTGAIAAHDDFVGWLGARGLYLPEVVRLHALTVFPTFVQASHRAQARGWDVVCTPDGADGAARARRVAWSEGAADVARDKRFCCLNDGLELHRQIVVSGLHALGRLDDSLVEFAAAPPELNDHCRIIVPGTVDLPERLRRAWLALQPELPLTVDRATAHRRSQLAIATAPAFEGYPVVDEQLLLPIVHRLPFLWVGPPDSLRYLRALGFQTFGRVLDERYDGPDGFAVRMVRLLGQIEALAARPVAALAELRAECRPELEHNRAHLLEGRHQLDELLRALDLRLQAA
jgi:hypothetical protein